MMKMEIKDMKGVLKMINMKEKEYVMMKMEIKNMKEILRMVNMKEKVYCII